MTDDFDDNLELYADDYKLEFDIKDEVQDVDVDGSRSEAHERNLYTYSPNSEVYQSHNNGTNVSFSNISNVDLEECTCLENQGDQGPPQIQPMYLYVSMACQYEIPIYQSQYSPPDFSEQFMASQISEEEFEECMDRNQRVSSSAIALAVYDVADGEYSVAIQTLVKAISLIEPSIVAQHKRCKELITTLKDVLHEVKKFVRRQRLQSMSHRRSRSRIKCKRSGCRSRCERSTSSIYRGIIFHRELDRDGSRSHHHGESANRETRDRSRSHEFRARDKSSSLERSKRDRSRSREHSANGERSDDSYYHYDPEERRSATPCKTYKRTNERYHGRDHDRYLDRDYKKAAKSRK